MAETPEFQKKQYDFAAHIRDPQNVAAPDAVEDRRMGIYRDLFFNNLLNLISQTFPVLKKLHTRDQWRKIVRKFMVQHQAKTPYFLQIPGEFLEFLQTEYESDERDFPFLADLAHYEWAELALSVSEETNDIEHIDPDGDLLVGIPAKSISCWAFAYQYPVHRINQDYQPTEPGEQPTILAICRKSNDDMDFMELNAVTARLLELIGENETMSGKQLLVQLATETGYTDVDAFIQHGATAMQDMRMAEVVIGTRR